MPRKPNIEKSAWRLPTLREPRQGWKTIGVFVYSIVADMMGLLLMLNHGSRNYPKRWLVLSPAILLAAHGRIIASYLVHESTHASIFQEPWANEWLGTLCLWLAGCPYADFDHVKFMHTAHHKDRSDVVEFDYRTFVKNNGPVVRNLVMALEWAFIPVVETGMHLRTSLYPIFWKKHVTESRRRNAIIGTLFTILFYTFLWNNEALLPHLVAGALILHFLSMHDAFQHTYEAVFLDNYKPGPGGRTPQFEEENTYSNLLSTSYPWFNLLSLNFGYHNAHHKKPMIPWYALPEWHNQIYQQESSKDANGDPAQRASAKTSGSPQVLPFCELITAWFAHRLRRVVDEDYGVVHAPDTPGRANDFVGALGVSFLTM